VPTDGARTERGGDDDAGPGEGGGAGDANSGAGGGAGGGAGAAVVGAGPPPRLCALSLHCDREIVDTPKILCAFAVTDGMGTTTFADHAGVELHGRSSLHFPKKNYSIELRDAVDTDKPTDLLGMGKESDWVLDGMWADRSLMRNALVYDAFRELGGARYASEGRYCTLSLDDQPQGIYRLLEKVKRDDDRVAIAADDGSGKSFIIKQDDGGLATLAIGLQSHWQLVYPKQDTASSAQLAGVQAWLDGLGAALASANPADAVTGVFSYLDLDATVDWLLFEELAKNIDAYNLSIYFTRDAGAPARLVPWDFDLSFGQPTVRDEAAAATNDQPSGWIPHRPAFIQVLAGIPALTGKLGARWRALRAGPLATAALAHRLDGYGVTLAPEAVTQNFTIWPLAAIDFPQIYAPYALYPVTSYQDETSRLRAFLEARLTWIDGHIDGYPS
jgi:hypothetical protein